MGFRFVSIGCTVSALLSASCSGDGGRDPGASAAGYSGGGVAGAGSGGAVTSGSSAGGSSGSAGGDPRCPGPSPSGPVASERLVLKVAITVSGKPLELGTGQVGASGLEYRLSFLKFFVSEPRVVDASGAQHEAQLLTESGAHSPYGVQLVDADDAASQTLRLAVPAGSYTALQVGIGLTQACNRLDPTTQAYPLTLDTEMYWSWATQFTFVRVEGETRTGEQPWADLAYHLGFDAAYRSVLVPGSITVPLSGTAPTLTLDVDRMFDPHGAPLPLIDHGGPESLVIDNLQNNQAFALQ